jgi:CheY-like chemotaxis protein
MKNNGSVKSDQRQEICADRKLNKSNDRVGLWETRSKPRAIEPVANAASWTLSGQLKRKVVLLVSEAAGFGRSLSETADLLELGFRQTGDPVLALWLAGQSRAAVVFVDLELPVQAGWNIAEHLLYKESAPTLILLAARNGHDDLAAAIRSGAVVDKSAEPSELLARVSQALAEPDSDRDRRIACQWMLLRWLKPYDCPPTATTVDRYRGINE